MTTRFCTGLAVAMFALLTTTPVRAAYVYNLDADVNLNFGSSEQLAGNIDLTYDPYYPCCGGSSNQYYVSADLSLNGTPLVRLPIGNTGSPEIQTYYTLSTNHAYPIDLEIADANLPNLRHGDFRLNGLDATGGTVTILSETLATPLPPALPLFGSAVLALAGFATWKSRHAAQKKLET